MNLEKIKIKSSYIAIGIIVLLLAFFAMLFGAAGLRIVFGLVIFLMLPTYFILGIVNFDFIERLLYSFFIGIALSSSIVYWIGLAVGSLRWGIGITFVLLLVIGFILKRLKKKGSLIDQIPGFGESV